MGRRLRLSTDRCNTRGADKWDPTVISAMISAIAPIGTSVFEKWGGASTQQVHQVDEKLVGAYDTLRAVLQNNSVRILRKLEDGQNRASSQLMDVISPNLARDKYDLRTALLHEIEFRLQVKETVGVITRPTSEYYITP